MNRTLPGVIHLNARKTVHFKAIGLNKTAEHNLLKWNVTVCISQQSRCTLAAVLSMVFHKPTSGFLWECFQRRLAAQWSCPVISFAPRFLTAIQAWTRMFTENRNLSGRCKFYLMLPQLWRQNWWFQSMPWGLFITWRESWFTCQDCGRGPPNLNIFPMRFQARKAGPEKNSSVSDWFNPIAL